MSKTTKTTETTETTESAPAPTATAQPQSSATQAPTVVTVDALPPEALSARLEQAKRSERSALLAELGVSDPAEAKAAIAAKKAAEEAAKSDADKLAALNLTVTAQARALTVAVNQAVASLAPEHKAILDGIAGADQAKWLELYGQLAPTWGKPVATAPTTTTNPEPQTAQPPAAPATTSPSGGAPSPTVTTQSPTNHAAVYASLAKSNPFAASRYADKHGDACFKQ